MLRHSTQIINLPQGVMADRPCFVLSDVHGYSALMREAISFAAASSPGHEMIMLGDLIDRGHDPIGCVRLAMSAVHEGPFSRVRLIRGNHELIMEEYLNAPGLVTGGALLDMGDTAIVAAGHDGEVLSLLRAYAATLEPWAVNGGLAFCHALPDPGLGLPRQTEISLYWNKAHQRYRGGWEALTGAPCVLVHGHVRGAPSLKNFGKKGLVKAIDETLITFGRVCCDTGCYETGELQLFEFQGNKMRVHCFS